MWENLDRGLYTPPRLTAFSNTDQLSSVTKIFIIYMANKKNIFFYVTGLYLLKFLLAKGDELNLNLPNFSRPLYFFFSSGLFSTSTRNIQSFLYLYFSLQLFTKKCNRSRCRSEVSKLACSVAAHGHFISACAR